MSEDLLTALILQLVGIALLVGEIFLPSHGMMTLMAVGCLGGGIYMAFQYGEMAGYLSVLATVIVLPTFAVAAVKLWPKTPFGRKIAPPNRPVETSESPAYQADDLERLIGKRGKALTLLRPVGTCEFDGQRLECAAESGTIPRDTTVVAIGVRGRSLIVRPVESA